MYSGNFTPLNDDDYSPIQPKLTHQHIDNYGIYSIVCLDHRRTGEIELRDYAFNSSTNSVTLNGIDSLTAWSDGGDSNLSFCLESFVAYQAFNPTQIPVSFDELIDLSTPTESLSITNLYLLSDI